MDTYEVEPDSQGGFQVVQIGPDGDRKHVTFGYRSREAAQALRDNYAWQEAAKAAR